jgi:O-antigen/teichoic acid export membrane protein
VKGDIIRSIKGYLGLGSSDRHLHRGLKNASFLSLGNLVSQAIGFVGLLFIARLFGPEKYGIYVTVLAFVTFFEIFDLSGLLKVIVREGSKDVESFERTLDNTIFLKTAFFSLALVLCVGASFLTHYSQTIKFLIILYSIELIHSGLESFLSAIYQTVEKMEYLAAFTVLTRFLITVLSIVFLYLGAGVLVILLVNLFSRFLVLLINFLISRRFAKFRFNFRLSLDPRILKATIIFSLMGIINTVAVKIDVLMLSFLTVSRDVGIYSVAQTFNNEGLILRNTAAMAFFPIAVKIFHSRTVRARTLLRYSFVLFFAVLAGCVVLSFFASDIVVLFFGDKYAASGQIFRYILFCLPSAFFMLPFTTALQATHNEQLLLVVFAIAAALNVPLNILFFYEFGVIGIAYSTLVVFLAQAVVLYALSIRRMKRQGYLV